MFIFGRVYSRKQKIIRHSAVLAAKNYFILNFDLMIDLLATRTIMRLKCVIMLVWVSTSWSKCQPPDWHCQILMNKFDLMNKLNFDLMKKLILISWNSTSWSFPVKNLEANFFEIIYAKFWTGRKSLNSQILINKIIFLIKQIKNWMILYFSGMRLQNIF